MLNRRPTDRWPQCVTKYTERKQKAKGCKRLKSIEKLFKTKYEIYLYLGLKIKGDLGENRRAIYWGIPRVGVLQVSKIRQRNQQPFPLCQCHFFVKNVCDTTTLGMSWGSLRAENVHCIRKKRGRGSPMACKFGKTPQPLLASLLIWNPSFSAFSSLYYRISYLSTKKVVSVENLTGLFPSTWVTLVTCMLQ